jgi:periplasmic protein CpxP/Spy
MRSSIVTFAGCKPSRQIYMMAASQPNYLVLTMIINKLVKYLPLLAIVVAVPTFAVSNYHHVQSPQTSYIAEGFINRRLDRLNLTPEQTTKIQQLRTTTKAQIDAVLTLEQRQKLAQIKAERQANRPNKAAGSLTPEQKAKLKDIYQASKEQLRTILTPEQQAQLPQDEGKNRHFGRFGGLGGYLSRLNSLNLTAEQKTKLEQLREKTRTQMNEVFTPEQLQQAKLRREQYKAMAQQWQSLNLTADQKAKLQEIRRSSKAQLQAILTPEQQQQARQKFPGHGGHWGGRWGGDQ